MSIWNIIHQIWRYHGTNKIADCALEQVHVDMDMPDGAVRTEILLAGGLNGSFWYAFNSCLNPWDL